MANDLRRLRFKVRDFIKTARRGETDSVRAALCCLDLKRAD
jgi:hypothetical protein